MSKVATAETGGPLGIPHRLHDLWNLTVVTSSLTGRLQGLLITSQRVELGGGSHTQDIYGGVQTVRPNTILGLMDGQTVVDDTGRQTVSFEIIFDGEHFHFNNGVLSADGSQIIGGSIEKSPLPLKTPPEFEPDGTWSATAVPGPTTDKPGKGKGRWQAGLHH